MDALATIERIDFGHRGNQVPAREGMCDAGRVSRRYARESRTRADHRMEPRSHAWPQQATKIVTRTLHLCNVRVGGRGGGHRGRNGDGEWIAASSFGTAFPTTAGLAVERKIGPVGRESDELGRGAAR